MNDTCLEVRSLMFLGKGPYSFSVAGGECLGLSGRSGIGKTQLFRAITDLIPSQGNLLLNDVPCSDFPAPQWRSKVTLVMADSSWWYDRVGDHFTMSHQNFSVSESLPLLGLPDEVMDWQVSHLSTGERQRLALIRALQNNPAVLLLDEPSSGLDTYHAELLETFVRRYQQNNGVAVVWVSHDAAQLERVASRQLRMEQDQLIEIVKSQVPG